jgi:2-polyprenyl-3-methyl-5-hydroxy-6-metoxy-1,4-benzoquinol methylase
LARETLAPLTERQRIEAAVYDARVRERLAGLSDDELRVDPRTPPFPNREHVDFLSFALGRLRVPRGASVLEVGSGSGTLSVYLALQGARVTGIDVSEENTRLAERRAAANGVAELTRFRAVPIEGLDDPDRTYDFIIGNQVLHHFELEEAIPNLHRLLRPGARAVFCEPVLLIPREFRQLRDTGLVKRVLPKRVDTPTERSVSIEDVALIRRVFPKGRLYPFHLLRRAENFATLSDAAVERLDRIDRFLLGRVPPLRRFCRFVVFDLVRETEHRKEQSA